MFTDAFGKIWYKGNLHTHTTNSDGAYTPEETIALNDCIIQIKRL